MRDAATVAAAVVAAAAAANRGGRVCALTREVVSGSGGGFTGGESGESGVEGLERCAVHFLCVAAVSDAALCAARSLLLKGPEQRAGDANAPAAPVPDPVPDPAAPVPVPDPAVPTAAIDITALSTLPVAAVGRSEGGAADARADAKHLTEI